MRIRRLSMVPALTLIASALVVAPIEPIQAQARPTGAVPTSERRVELAPATSFSAAGGAHTTREDLRLARTQAVRAGLSPAAVDVAAPKVLEVSPPQTIPTDIAVIGLSWSSSVGRSTVVQYRTHAHGAWGAWEAIDIDPTKGTDAEGGRAGSDPIVVSDSDQVQVRVLGPAGGAPADATLAVIDPGESDADTNIGAARAGTASAAAARPTIHSRAEWGANEGWRKGAVNYTGYRGVIVHHTAGTNNYSPSQVPAILRGIYAFHTKDRGWSDIAYNFLVDKWGRVWEGRYGGINRSVQGAHALGYNTQTMGVSVMGDYMKTDISPEALRSVERVIAWKAGLSGFDPAGTTTLYGRREPVVQGHRDVGNTTCPGTYIYAKMKRIRTESRAMMSGSASGGTVGGTPPAGRAPATGAASSSAAPGAADVLLRGTTGVLMRSTPTATNDMTFAARVSSSNWAGYDAVLSAGDVDGDGHSDLLARVKATGRLVFFRGAPGGVLAGAREVGSGWNAMTQLSSGADYTGDRRVDLVAVQKATGRLYVYPGLGNGTFGRALVMGTGFGALTFVTGLGDYNGDGKADVLGVTRAGVARVYLGTGRARISGSTTLPGSWSAYATIVGLQGRQGVFAVDRAGKGYVITRAGKSTRVTKTTPTFTGLAILGG